MKQSLLRQKFPAVPYQLLKKAGYPVTPKGGIRKAALKSEDPHLPFVEELNALGVAITCLRESDMLLDEIRNLEKGGGEELDGAILEARGLRSVVAARVERLEIARAQLRQEQRRRYLVDAPHKVGDLVVYRAPSDGSEREVSLGDIRRGVVRDYVIDSDVVFAIVDGAIVPSTRLHACRS